MVPNLMTELNRREEKKKDINTCLFFDLRWISKHFIPFDPDFQPTISLHPIPFRPVDPTRTTQSHLPTYLPSHHAQGSSLGNKMKPADGQAISTARMIGRVASLRRSISRPRLFFWNRKIYLTCTYLPSYRPSFMC